jgi:hypothetical protein
LSASAVSRANQFTGHLTYIESTRAKMEKFINTRNIVRRDIDQIYRGLYLEAVCSFERFIEDLFIGLLVDRLKHPSPTVVPRVTFRSGIVARDVVFGGSNYVDWLPYSYTEKRANAFFRNGLPFTSLDPNDKRIILQICHIRNAIAHKSNYANNVFIRNVIGNIPFSPRDRTPAAFLRSRFRIAPVQTRYENLTTEMSIIAVKLCI